MELKIKVGASRDSSFDQIFRSFTDASRQANAMATADTRRAAKLEEKIFLEKIKAERDILHAQLAETKAIHDMERRSLEQSLQRRGKARMQAVQAETAKELALTKEAARAKADIEVAQAKEAARRETQIALLAVKERTQAERQAATAASRGPGRDFAYRVGLHTARNFSPITPMLSFGQRVASDLVRGTGIDFNFGTLFQNRVQSEQQAVALSNAAFMPGEAGAAGQRQNPRALMEEAKKVADETGFGRTEALSGLQKFVGVSGDLATGRAVLKDMAVLARATDSSLDDMVEAAGNAANQLGNAKDKGALLHAIMASVAGQGKIGAVEIKDMAHQMAALAAQAPMFGGNPAENIMMMGVLAQEARQRGGAKSAAQATTAVTSFVNTLTKGARLKEMMAAGVIKNPEEIRTLGPQELITRMLKVTQGKELPMNKLVMDVQAKRAIRGFQILFNEAGGGDAGLKAVAAEFDRLKKATMANAEIQDSFKAAMDTTTTKAQLFQNKLQDVADKLAEKAIPALEKLEGPALKVVDGFGQIAGWLAENPFAIIPAAITASFAKGLAEQTLRVGTESLIRGNRITGAGTGQGVLGNVAAALTIASAALTIYQVGSLFIDKVMSDESDKQKKAITGEIAATNAESDYRGALRAYNKSPTAENAQRVEETKASLRSAAEDLKPEESPGFVKRLFESIVRIGGVSSEASAAEGGNTLGANADVQAVEAEQKRRHEEMMRVQNEQKRLLELIAGNAGGPGPGIDGSGRTGFVPAP